MKRKGREGEDARNAKKLLCASTFASSALKVFLYVQKRTRGSFAFPVLLHIIPSVRRTTCKSRHCRRPEALLLLCPSGKGVFQGVWLFV